MWDHFDSSGYRRDGPPGLCGGERSKSSYKNLIQNGQSVLEIVKRNNSLLAVDSSSPVTDFGGFMRAPANCCPRHPTATQWPALTYLTRHLADRFDH